MSPVTLEFLNDLPPSPPMRFWEYAAGCRLGWTEYGDGKGFPVMFYHGWPSAGVQGRVVHHLARERGLRLIATDRPGIGGSTRVQGRRLGDWPGLLGRFADFLEIDGFGQLGVSGGGPYVLACAAAIPERVRGSAVLAGMVPLAWVPGGEKYLGAAYRRLLPFRKLPACCLAPVFRGFAFASRWNPGLLPEKWTSSFMPARDREILAANPDGWEAIALGARDCIRHGTAAGVLEDAHVYFEDPGFAAGDVTSPIAWWHGEADRHIGVELARMLAETMPGLSLEVVPEQGHFSLALETSPTALDYLAKECRGDEDPQRPQPLCRLTPVSGQ